MLKSREIFSNHKTCPFIKKPFLLAIQTSIDNLANKFTELENSYYGSHTIAIIQLIKLNSIVLGFLLRSQEENQNT
ncbi:MAG TPA: hypothetical protein PLS50_09270, partial [Candidatus Dojkabacteria bacterium]|nr:hypothetical protein [Candidatus Dojkabacteria bacterium]